MSHNSSSTKVNRELIIQVFRNKTCQFPVIKEDEDPGLGSKDKRFYQKTVIVLEFLQTGNNTVGSVRGVRPI